MDRVFAGAVPAVLDQDERSDVVSGLVGRRGGDRDSVRRRELQRIEAANVYSSDLSAFGVGTGDLVEWAGLSPLRKNRLGICADFPGGARADALVRAACLERSGGGDALSGVSFGSDFFGCHSDFGLGMENQKGRCAGESGMGGGSDDLSMAWGQRGDGTDQ